MVPLTLVITLLFTLTHSAVAGAERWRAPLPTVAVAQPFDFDASAPFAAGLRRRARLAGEPGQTVRAPCSGRVTFAGRVPRLGSGVSLRCGPLVATAFGLRSVRAGSGRVVIAGAPIGLLGAGGTLWLGARLASSRRAYRDPLTLIGAASDRPLGPAPLPLRRARVAPPRPPATAPGPVPAAPSPLLLAAWAGVAIAGLGAGLGVTLRRRPRRSHRLRADADARRFEATG